MRDDSSPDLFAWADSEPRTAKLIPFPLSRALGRARRVAQTFLDRKTDKGQKAFWARTVGQLERHMRNAGFDDHIIDLEIAAFRDAVQTEIYRFEREGQRPGGAA